MKNLLLLLLFAVVTKTAHAQIINTVAGDGGIGYTGDSVLSIAARLAYPLGIALDNANNIYIGDNGNCRIRKINTTTGIITTIAGTGVAGYSGDGGPASNAKINEPHEIAFDIIGNLYFADHRNNCVRKIDTSGIISTIAGTGIAGYSGDGGPATSARINRPWGITTAENKCIYITEELGFRVRKIDSFGIITTVAGNGIGGLPGDGGLATNGCLIRPMGITTDASGNLYIADQSHYRVRKVNSSGLINSIAGGAIAGYSGDSGPATAALLNSPTAVALNTAGEVFISDIQNNCIRKIDAAGIITTISGNGTSGFSGDGGTATAALLYQPGQIAITSSGAIYFCDAANGRIRIIQNNYVPHFTHGVFQSLTACPGTVGIDTQLQAIDANPWQPLTWSLVTAPAHGVAMAGYTSLSLGSLLTPAGLTYTPDIGYTGPDTFKVRVTDGSLSDTTIICVNVHAVPHTSGITGRDSVCVGATIVLADTATGGTWASTGGVTVAGSAVTGIAPGTATVTYTITNDCGTATATKTITVLPSPDAGNVAGADTLCPGDTATLIANIPGGSWTSANTAIASISAGGRVHALATGRDTVRYTITNGYCSATALHYLYVQPFTACNTGIEALQHTTNETIEIAPNPSNGNCTVWLKSPITQQATLIITNAIGIKVKHAIINTNEPITIALDQPAGIYYISVSSASGMYMSKMMVGK